MQPAVLWQIPLKKRWRRIWTSPIVRIMKLVVVLLTVCFIHAGARGLAQGNITLNVKDLAAEKVFKELKKQTGLRFVYTDDLLNKLGKVTIDVKNANIDEVLHILLAEKSYTYSIVDNNVVVIEKQKGTLPSINAESVPSLISVKGRIVNEKGEPVVGASIRIKGTDKGTSTNENGEFTLAGVEANAILVISAINIETVEMKVDGKSELPTVTIKTRVIEGEQVIISNGYTKAPPERLIGSFSQLNNANYERRAGMDIITRLDGTVTGMLFDKKEGGYQIRGFSTLTGFAQSASPKPLIIVDNFPFKQDLNTINPNDIESITLLKDAAAASIWGAQAGNGVIVITTKKGKYRQPIRISVSSNITIQQAPDLYYNPQMTMNDFVDAEVMLFNKGAYDAKLADISSWPVISPVVEMLAKRRSGLISSADSASQIEAFKEMDLRGDLDKYVYRPAISQQHYINANGGSNTFNYSFSGGYNRNLNNTKNSKPDDQFTINSNVGFRPTEKLQITSGLYYSQTTQKSADFSLTAPIYPYAQLADAEGNPLAVPDRYREAYVDTAGGGQLLDWRYRPLEEMKLTDRVSVIRLLQLNTGISYHFTNWLNALISYQYASQSSNDNNYYDPKTYFARDLVNRYTNLAQSNSDLRYPVPPGGILEILHSEINTQNARAQLDINKSFGINHRIVALLAGEVSEAKTAGVRAGFYGYNNDFGTYKSHVDYLATFPLYGGNGIEHVPNDNLVFPATNSRFVSFLGNASYTYKDLYSVYGSARKDGSNMFGVNTNRKWKPLWSAGASWSISKEGFYDIKWLPYLRLRASYGYSGNPGNATGVPTLRYATTPSSLANLTYASPNDPPNPDLRWEKVRTINMGLDFSLFKNKLAGSLDIWQKKSTDIISTSPLAPSTGNLVFITNVASLKGHGFELNLTSRNMDGVFKWQTNFGLTYAKTIVTNLYNGGYRASDFIGYGLNPSVGRIVFGIASYKWAGLDPLTGDPRGYLNKQVSTDYLNIFSDSINNAVFHGSAIPLYFGFILNSFSWKNITLSANITYRLGFYFRKPSINYDNLVNNWQGHSDYDQRWQQPGDEKRTNVPSFTYPINSNRELFYQYSEVNILRGDNIRLADLRLQYSLNNKNFKTIPIKNIDLFVYANNLNLILWKKNKSKLDPDFEGGKSIIGPAPKTLTLGINLNL